MKTKPDQKTFAVALRLIHRGLLFAIAAFAAFNAFSSTNALQVDLKVRFVRLQPNSDWWDNMDWFALAHLTNHSQMLSANLSSSQFQTVLKRIEQHDGVDLINEEQLTTLNGRQARFHIFNTNTSPIDQTFDVMPTVSDDDLSIQLTLVPTVTEVLGDGKPAVTLTNADGSPMPPIMIDLPLPRTRVRQITMNYAARDGQTFVLGEFPDNSKILNKSLLIFITPTLIDSFGHRTHSGDYYDSLVFPGFGGGGFRAGGQ